MPGFNLFSESLQPKTVDYQFDGFAPIQWKSDSKITLSSQGWKGYPAVFNEEASYYFEGYIYNAKSEEIAKSIKTLLEKQQYKAIAEIIKPLDGEFVFIFATESGYVIVNDPWGRLPIYTWSANGQLIVSRNISFIADNTSLELDSVRSATMLLFGFNLGEATNWKHVNKIPPHSITSIQSSDHSMQIKRYFSVSEVSGNATIQEAGDEIITYLKEGLKNRIEQLPQTTLSLSGGLDSRLTVAALAAIDEHIPLITYHRPGDTDALDIESAKKISRSIQREKEHEIVAIPQHKFEDTLEIMQFKRGMNCASMGFVLPYHRMHQERSISSIADDGGGKFFRDLYPFYDLNSISKTVRYIVKKHGACSISEAATICGCNEKELYTSIEETLKAYPYKNANDVYSFFSIREIGVNWAYEGGDRNRHYNWITTPFYHPKVIENCLAIPQRDKAHGRLFNYLYTSLPGKLQNVLNPNWKQEVNDEKQIKRLFDRQRIKSRIPTTLLKLKSDIAIDTFEFGQELKSLIDEHKGPLHVQKLKKKNSDNFYWQLLTLLLIESIKSTSK